MLVNVALDSDWVLESVVFVAVTVPVAVVLDFVSVVRLV